MQQRYNFLSIIIALTLCASARSMQRILTHENQSEVTSQSFADEQIKAALNTLLKFEEQGVYKRITVSPNGELIASAEKDTGLISLVDVETGAWTCRLLGHCSADLLIWSPKSTHLATHTVDDTIYLWDVQTGKCIDVFQQPAEDEMDRPSLQTEIMVLCKKYKKPLTAILFLTVAQLLYKISQ